MLKKRCVQIVRLGLMWSVVGCSALPFALASQPQVPQMTLQVSEVEGVDAETWCNGANARGTGRPLGFNRVGVYRDSADSEKKEFLIGCITNNSGKNIEGLIATYTEELSSTGGSVGSVTIELSTETLEPGQTAFFDLMRDFGFHPNSTGATFDIYRWSSGGPDREPLERLIIQRR